MEVFDWSLNVTFVSFFISWFTTYPSMDVCYDSSFFRVTLHDQIGSEHVPVWLIVRQGYIARPNMVRLGVGVTHLNTGVNHLTTGVHCTTKYRQTTSDMMHTGFLIRTFGDVSERGKGACPYTVPSCPPWVFGFHKTDHTLLLISDTVV